MTQRQMPLEVLADALADKIRKRPVRTALFTTFTFDPGFFELHILPLLFDRPFSQVDKVRLIQLEDALRSVEEIAVYYDRTALTQGGTPAQLDFRRIDVRRATGVFHPKMVLVLVENPVEVEEEDDEFEPRAAPLSLIVGTLSANITRSGWWENVETGHFEEIPDRELRDKPCPFRKDLLSLIKRIRTTAAEGEEHAALDRIHQFLRERTNTEPVSRASFGGSQSARIYSGQSDLPSWLEGLRLGRKEWNLEIISPYFDADHAGTLSALIDAIEPKETRVYLPTNSDGSAAVRSELYKAVSELATWSILPGSVRRSGGRSASEKLPPRRVHAKVYRLWRKNSKDIVLTGSVNLTSAAHSHGNAGNLEAAFLVDATDDIQKRWWLEPIDREPTIFAEHDPDEAEETQDVFVDISFRFDWATASLHYSSAGLNIPPSISIPRSWSCT